MLIFDQILCIEKAQNNNNFLGCSLSMLFSILMSMINLIWKTQYEVFVMFSLTKSVMSMSGLKLAEELAAKEEDDANKKPMGKEEIKEKGKKGNVEDEVRIEERT